MQRDEADPVAQPDTSLGRVTVGRYALVLGDRAGMEIVPIPGTEKPRALARAIAQSRRKRGALSRKAKKVEEDISQTTSGAEHAVKLFTEIAQGRLDPTSISDEVEALTGLMRSLDGDERWDEALRLARPLAALLALLARWVDLLQALRVAVGAAERLGDTGAEGWALHELGTLHLAAEDHAGADRLLGRARDLREQTGDRRELAMTDRSFQILCRALRAKLHKRSFRHVFDRTLQRPSVALAIALSLLALGGVAGAEINNSGDSTRLTANRPSIVRIKLTPISPRVGERVAFRASIEGTVEPERYAWQFGDGHRSVIASPTHTYKRPGIFKADVSVRGAHGETIGRATRVVDVHESVSKSSSFPSADFSFTPSSPVAGASVTFDAMTSSDPDPDASIVSYRWRFGDNRTETGPAPTHAFANPGVYTTELTVTDTRGATGSTSHRIVVVPPTTITNTKKSSSIRMACPRNPAPRETVTIAGILTPPNPKAIITVTYTPPSETPETETLETNSNGAYQSAATLPRQAGRWLVQSSWAGDEEYEPATSQTCVFSVE